MKALLAILALSAAASARAQDLPPSPKPADNSKPPKLLSLSFELKASPAIGRSLVPDSSNSLLDESEYSTTLTVERDMGTFKLTFAPSLSYSPNYYSGGDPESTVALSAGIARNESRDPAKPVPEWYFGYDLGMNYSKLLESRSFTDHTFKAGINFKSRGFVFCPSSGGKTTISTCQTSNMFVFVITPEIAFTASTNSDRRRITPSVVASFKGPVGPTSLITSIKLETRLFSEKLATASNKQADWRLTIYAGIDVGKILDKDWPKEVSFKVGGKYVRNWSNLASARFERGFIVPTISITINN